MQKTIVLDANAILRYLLHDIAELADEVENILIYQKVLILPEVVAEVIYIMTKVYGLTHNAAAEKMLFFLDDIENNNNILREAVVLFGEGKFDFVDCVLFEYSKLPFYEVVTFDKRLKKKIVESTSL